jgi:hypothetical protein
MGIVDKIKALQFVKDEILYRKFGNNIHDIDLNETIQTGVVDRLMKARELGIDYCVVVGGVVPSTKTWDKFGDGTWNPPRDYISTEDIATADRDPEQELKNIYDFLRGKKLEEEIKHSK